jgi:hypothetical protein
MFVNISHQKALEDSTPSGAGVLSTSQFPTAVIFLFLLIENSKLHYMMPNATW